MAEYAVELSEQKRRHIHHGGDAKRLEIILGEFACPRIMTSVGGGDDLARRQRLKIGGIVRGV